MTVLKVPCEHGKWEAHLSTFDTRRWQWDDCPGGREPTVEEITQWLKERTDLWERPDADIGPMPGASRRRLRQ